jgi:hypothetical protein
VQTRVNYPIRCQFVVERKMVIEGLNKHKLDK